MTKLLEEAFAKASNLSEEQQTALAAVVLEEIASEQRWADSFAKSQDQLAAMADEALREHATGRTRPFERDSDLAND